MATWSERVSGLLTHDFCPWANRWVYWIKQPAAALGLAGIAALACAVFVQPLAWIPFAAVLLVVVLGYLWPSMAVRGLAAEVVFPQCRVTEGTATRVILRVVNKWPWPVWGISLEGGFGASPTVALALIAGWSSSEFVWEFTPQCRGEYPQSIPRITTGFPFGLRHASRPATVHGSLLVWPQVIPLETLLDAAETRPTDDVCSETRVGDSGDVMGTRLFRAGDSLRRVHWAHTARLGRMIVCERQAPARTAVRVVFDSDPHLHRGAGANSTLEWSIRLAASVLSAYHREHAAAECCFGHHTWPIAPGTLGWQRFMDQLSRWQPCDDHYDPDCEHEHNTHQCRKIHHRHCGAFQITITTDLGLAHRTEHRHVHGDQRLIVLSTAGENPSCDVCGNEHRPPVRQAMVLEHPQRFAEDFHRQWRLACHAG